MKKFILKNTAILFASFVLALLLPGLSFSQNVLSEDFSTAAGSTPPAGWDTTWVVGDPTYDRWYFDNPNLRAITPPIVGNAAIFDSKYNDCQNPPVGSCFQNCDCLMAKEVILESPPFDASLLDTIWLSWNQSFWINTGVTIIVKAYNDTTWTTVWDTTVSVVSPVDQQRAVNISSIVAGASNAAVSFVYTTSISSDSYWIVDNVNIVAGCAGQTVADFSADITQGCDTLLPPLTVQFSDSSTGATGWSWTFPGGTPAADTSQNPTVMYGTAGIYGVTLTASGICGDSTVTKSAYITVDTCGTVGGINELIGFESLTISPNPTTGELNITFDVNEVVPTSIKIYNVIGELITETSQPNGLLKGDYNFDLSAQPDGAYFVKLESGDRVVTRKVNIIR